MIELEIRARLAKYGHSPEQLERHLEERRVNKAKVRHNHSHGVLQDGATVLPARNTESPPPAGASSQPSRPATLLQASSPGLHTGSMASLDSAALGTINAMDSTGSARASAAPLGGGGGGGGGQPDMGPEGDYGDVMEFVPDDTAVDQVQTARLGLA